MGNAFHRHLFILLLSSLIGSMGKRDVCAKDDPEPLAQRVSVGENANMQDEMPKLTWQSRRLATVEAEWKSIVDSFKGPRTKSSVSELARLTSDLLRKRLSHADMRELATSCGTLPLAQKDWSNFQADVLDEMVLVFLESADRESLVTLLSTRFPKTIGFQNDIEYCLVRGAKKMKDPVLVLEEAYMRCGIPEVRKDIAAAVRRGFKGSGISGKHDGEFVNNAMQWYKWNKVDLVLNDEYRFNSSWLLPKVDNYLKNPLFVRKGGKAGSLRQ